MASKWRRTNGGGQGANIGKFLVGAALLGGTAVAAYYLYEKWFGGGNGNGTPTGDCNSLTDGPICNEGVSYECLNNTWVVGGGRNCNIPTECTDVDVNCIQGRAKCVQGIRMVCDNQCWVNGGYCGSSCTNVSCVPTESECIGSSYYYGTRCNPDLNSCDYMQVGLNDPICANKAPYGMYLSLDGIARTTTDPITIKAMADKCVKKNWYGGCEESRDSFGVHFITPKVVDQAGRPLKDVSISIEPYTTPPQHGPTIIFIQPGYQHPEIPNEDRIYEQSCGSYVSPLKTDANGQVNLFYIVAYSPGALGASLSGYKITATNEYGEAYGLFYLNIVGVHAHAADSYEQYFAWDGEKIDFTCRPDGA